MTSNENSTLLFDKLPPYYIKDDFFGQALVDQLLEHVNTNQDHFKSSTVGSNEGRIDPNVRVSSILYDFGVHKEEIKLRFKGVFLEAIEQLKMPHFELHRTEREIVAHTNGAFYSTHIDTFTGASESSVRALTAVYYFYAQPKRFQGGDLRLLPLRNREVDSVYLDIEPKNDRLLLFPSWVPHRVMPVVSSSTEFKDSRFAINCWYHKLKS